MHYGEYLKSLATKSGFSQTEIAERMGIKRTALLYYFSRKNKPDSHFIFKFSHAISLPISELKDAPQIAIYGAIAAGKPINAIENVEGYIDAWDYDDVDSYFALRIKGVSMYPRIKTGDVVIFHKQANADNEDIVAVFVGGDDATCKQLILKEDGITLHALNESFGDMNFTAKQVEEMPITIIGKAVELRAKL